MAVNDPASSNALSFEIKNREALSKALKSAQSNALDLRVPLTLIGRSMFKFSQLEIFNLSGKGQYQDLSPAYKKRKQKKFGFIYPILKAKGRLQASLTELGNPENYFAFPNARTVEWGTKVPYGVYHQSEAPRKKLPRRPFLLVTDARLRAWKTTLKVHLGKAFTQPTDENFKIGGTD